MRRKRLRKTPSSRDLNKSSRAKEIGAALGSSRSFAVETAAVGPFGAAALVREVSERLISAGGRPGDPAPTIRRLVPIRKAVWEDLKKRAAALSAFGRSVSPGQLAAILLEKSLEEGRPDPQGKRAG